MRVFYLMFLFAIPSLTFSQNLSASNDYNSQRNTIYQHDPFTTKMLSVDNPCNDREYVALKNLSGQQMSAEEHILLERKEKACQVYVKNLVETELAKKVEVTTDTRPFFILTGTAVVISVFVIIIV